MAARPIVEATDGRFEGILLIALVVLVMIAWAGGLIFLAVHFL